jgi:hypothetical protein
VFGDCVSVRWRRRERAKDEQVERALEQIETVRRTGGHSVESLRFIV